MSERLGWLKAHINHEGDECLAWPWPTKSGVIGTIRFNGRTYRPSRAMCELRHGPPPAPNLDAAHSCGRGHLGCVAPNHLSWKTRKENLADMVGHGTAPRGENCGTHKLTAAQVREIRTLKGTEYQYVLAARFGISKQQMSRIIRGERWKYLP